ncbi:unnamed protein product, partial [Thelazia callipaeda]|uniref:Ground-like domain-containing protein n=1 Tax=Thelazia callipaeda TaxID=103827 RepID=A0A0N5CRJ7_THECL
AAPPGRPSVQAESRASGVVTVSANKCNSARLEDLLTENMDDMDPVTAKRAIHKAAQENFKGEDVDIICSDSGFTYIVSTEEYCEAQKGKIICFIFKSHNPPS